MLEDFSGCVCVCVCERVRVSLCRLQMMWTTSNVSDKLCERIIKTGLHADMLKHLSWKTLSADTLNDDQLDGSRYFVNAHAGTMHNVVRRIESAREPFRRCQAVNVVQKFRNVTKYPVIFNLFSLYYYAKKCVRRCTLVSRRI